MECFIEISEGEERMNARPLCELCVEEKAAKPEAGFIVVRFRDGSQKFICGKHHMILTGKK